MGELQHGLGVCGTPSSRHDYATIVSFRLAIGRVQNSWRLYVKVGPARRQRLPSCSSDTWQHTHAGRMLVGPLDLDAQVRCKTPETHMENVLIRVSWN